MFSILNSSNVNYGCCTGLVYTAQIVSTPVVLQWKHKHAAMTTKSTTNVSAIVLIHTGALFLENDS